MQRLGKTIWAAILGAAISGVLGVGGVILAVALKPAGVTKPPIVITEQLGKDLAASERSTSLTLVQSLVTLPKGRIDELEIGRFDFVGGRDQKEIYFIATYRDSGIYYGIVTERTGRPELLFYEKGDLFSSIGFQPFYIDEKPFVLAYTIAGSGSYMYARILAYDGIKTAQTVWTVPAMASGFFFFQGNKLMIRGNNMRYNVVYKDGSFSLSRYPERYGLNTNAVHVLRIDTTNDHLLFYFDGKEVTYKKGEFESIFDRDVTCSQDSIIVIDDNFSDQNRYVRILISDGELDYHSGYFDHVSFPKKNRTELMISDSYSMWYNLGINVE